ncbi:hypothetical protein E2C01_025496 [Portunus trituberculatus]|uniref:Uncharacterized protein n=1 Tax=Portunus trituberculatus TaxID=210409 RepID=A0A5B7EDG8_PORTR|nr:hypothetical protein [Portunus trituberculatus]
MLVNSTHQINPVIQGLNWWKGRPRLTYHAPPRSPRLLSLADCKTRSTTQRAAPHLLSSAVLGKRVTPEKILSTKILQEGFREEVETR